MQQGCDARRASRSAALHIPLDLSPAPIFATPPALYFIHHGEPARWPIRFSKPCERLRCGVDLVIMAGRGEHHELVEVVFQPGGGREKDQTGFHLGGLDREAFNLVTLGFVSLKLVKSLGREVLD